MSIHKDTWLFTKEGELLLRYRINCSTDTNYVDTSTTIDQTTAIENLAVFQQSPLFGTSCLFLPLFKLSVVRRIFTVRIHFI